MLNKNDFISKAMKIHGNMYDYSLSNYKGSKHKIKIKCFRHGFFYQIPSNHLRGSGCPECSKEKLKITFSLGTKDVIDRAVKIHGERYDYSLFEYKGAYAKIKIICSKHGVFEQGLYVHLKGCGCPKCGIENRSIKNDMRGVRVGSNKKEFVNKAIKLHGNKYDYALVVYTTNRNKVKIICPKHGVFQQEPQHHLRGCGCPKCGIENRGIKTRSNKEDFVSKAIQIHGNKYDYSLAVYKNCDTKIKISCPKHGVFKQCSSNHLSGHGCPKCFTEANSQGRLHKEIFVSRATKIHGNKYDYSLVRYKKVFDRIKIICPKHGVFKQAVYSHLKGSGCQKCAIESTKSKNASNREEFIKKAIKIHNNKYDYSGTVYTNSRTKIRIMCPIHGAFLQMPTNHLNGAGCPSCSESQGERKIAIILNGYGIKYEKEKKFNQCRNVRNMRFDFYIPALNTCIEYDGVLHYYPFKYFGGTRTLERIKKTDAIKNSFCLNNNIKLIRISYERSDTEVASILEKELIQPSVQV